MRQIVCSKARLPGRRRCSLLRLACALLMLGAPLASAQWAQLASPDGRLQVTVDQLDLGAAVTRYPQGEYVYFRVTLDGALVVDWSPLGLRLSDRAFTTDLALLSATTIVVSDSYSLISGKRRQAAYTANELTLRVEASEGDHSEWVLRAFNDGLAFQYRVPGSGAVDVLEELSGFRLPAGSTGYLAQAQTPAQYEPSYEVPYVAQAAGSSAGPEGFYYPALFALPGGRFALIHEAGLTGSYAATRLQGDASENLYRLRFPSVGEGDPTNAALPRVVLPFATPWRVLAVGDAAAIVETDLVTHLSAPADAVFGGDLSWIKPGVAAWSWWSQGTGTPTLQREYVDFAAEQGWEYIVVDEGWSQWPPSEMVDLIQYAAAQGVGVFVWYNSGGSHNSIPLQPRDRLNTPSQIQSEFAILSQLGVAGVKIDFFRSDKQARIGQYLEILRTAAQYRLLVNLHGATVPRGWQREFPNLLTTEAVLGAEYYKWNFGPSASDNVLLAFTRNVVGAMDYTPLTFDAALSQKGISYAHQLALPGLFESGLQTFAGRADSDPLAEYRVLFQQYPFVADYLGELPTGWDETRLLEGHPASHAVIARRSGARWYVSGVNGDGTERSVSINLGDFADNFYRAELIEQGVTADALQFSTLELDNSSSLALTLQSRGGFVLVLKPRQEQSPWRDAPFDESGIWRVTWMGHLIDSYFPFILHREHDWLYAFNDDPDALWLWSESGGWWWTSQQYYPQIYEANTGHLLFYAQGTDNPRWFYDSATQEWLPR